LKKAQRNTATEFAAHHHTAKRIAIFLALLLRQAKNVSAEPRNQEVWRGTIIRENLMTTTKGMLVSGLAACFIALNPAAMNAQTLSSQSGPSIQEIVSLSRELAAAEPVEEKIVPILSLEPSLSGAFWSLQQDTPPLPFLPFPELETIEIAPGVFLFDDRAVDYLAVRRQIRIDRAFRTLEAEYGLESPGMMTMSSGVPTFPGEEDYEPGEEEGGPFYTSEAYSYGANDFWLEITGVSNNWAFLTLHGTEEDVVYDILSKEALDGTNGWFSEGTPILGLAEQTPTALSVAGRGDQLFFRARSWADSDGSGMPDWWQMQWFGHLGIDPYDDPDGDGLTNLQEYQAGSNPLVFDTPSAPSGLSATLNLNQTTATVEWNPLPGPVLYYNLERADPVNWELGSFQQLAQVSAGTAFTDTGSFEVSTELYTDPVFLGGDFAASVYRVRAVYPNGSSLPATVRLSTQRTNLTPTVSLVRNSTGRWQLIFSRLPVGTQKVRLTWATYDRPWDNFYPVFAGPETAVTNLAGGTTWILPDSETTNHIGDFAFVQAIGPDGKPGNMTPAGRLLNDAPYFVDGRAHLKQNLAFLLRAASMNHSYTFYGDDFHYETYYFCGSSDYAEAGFCGRNTGGGAALPQWPPSCWITSGPLRRTTVVGTGFGI
jgi:hypothetical protein